MKILILLAGMLFASYAGFRYYSGKKFFNVMADIEKAKAIVNTEYKGSELQKMKLQEQVGQILTRHNVTEDWMKKEMTKVVSDGNTKELFK